MRSLITLFIASLFFLGCSTTVPTVKPNEKSFEQEDTFIIFALDAQERKQYRVAAEYYGILYEKSPREEYQKRYYEMLLQAQDYETVEQKARAELLIQDNVALRRYLITALIGSQKYEEAKTEALALVTLTKEPYDYLLLSDLYIRQQHFDTALKYLESAYLIDYNEQILDKMVVVMYINLQRKKDAIAQLESHSRIHGCSKSVCSRLAGFYSAENNIDGLLNTYKRYYELNKDEETAEAIIRIYSYQKDFAALQMFLEESAANDDMLLRLYINAKNYNKSAVLAEKLYESEGDILYLGQNAIMLFEGAEDRTDPKLVNEVIEKLKKVVNKEDNALYQNYLGYLMIDNDIEIKEGISYVKLALEKEPDSPYYLDSLAWGYYKLGQCMEADKLMKKVRDKIGDDDQEVMSHIKAIEECLRH